MDLVSEEITFLSCYAKWDGVRLTVGNDLLERIWRVENGVLFAESLRDKATDFEWLVQKSHEPSWLPPVAIENVQGVHFSAEENHEMPVSSPHLQVALTVSGDPSPVVYRFCIFPHTAAITGQVVVENLEALDSVDDGVDVADPTGVELEDAAKKGEDAPHLDVLDVLMLEPQHVRVTQVTLMDRTDVHNELVFENEWLLLTNENGLRLQGNLFVIEDVLNECGMIVLKQAPLPNARPIGCDCDVSVQGRNRMFRFCGHGMGEGVGEGYPATVITYQNGAVGRQEALQQFQRNVRLYEAKRDGQFLSNTWGDRSRDARVQEAFVLKEIAAGSKLGVDVVQIDDGWEQGTTSNSVNAKSAGGVWEGFWASDPNFWHHNVERFPNGLEPVIEAARKEGMQFGLWFGPDSANDFANWEKDADTILDFHTRLGVNYIKIDGVKARTKKSEQNLRQFFDRVLTESQGRVTFDLDVTAEIRPGYFGMMHVGPLFVENRYTDFHRYWPHQTLRNLWKLSRWVDPLRLRMEFLNNARNTDLYTDDPLAPHAYQADYLFATVMMSNPLGWFEVSNLPEEYSDCVARLVSVWKSHRAFMSGGNIHPIGEAPDGTAWTGFASVQVDRKAGYLLLFRELNDHPSCRLELPMFANDAFDVTVLAGEGAASLDDGVLAVEIPNAQRFLFVRVVAKENA